MLARRAAGSLTRAGRGATRGQRQHTQQSRQEMSLVHTSSYTFTVIRSAGADRAASSAAPARERVRRLAISHRKASASGVRRGRSRRPSSHSAAAPWRQAGIRLRPSARGAGALAGAVAARVIGQANVVEWPRSTETQSPTRRPACSVTIRIVFVPPISTVYSKPVDDPAAPPTRLPTAAPPTPRNARLLGDCPEPDATPSAPPTMVPAALRALVLDVAWRTAVMRPWVTVVCCAWLRPPRGRRPTTRSTR